jgi:hypothetical protein
MVGSIWYIRDQWAQYEKWWEPCQKRSGQLFYGCDDVLA